MTPSNTPIEENSSSSSVRPENRLRLDYRAEAKKFAALEFPIVDIHSHINGGRAAEVYGEAAQAYGIGLTYSMTSLEDVGQVKSALGDRIRFITIPDFFAADRFHALSEGYAERIRAFHDWGATIAKFWSAPRGVDFALMAKAPADSFRLDAPHVRKNMELAIKFGMDIMVHVGDPDTWFATHYQNATRYGTKIDQYQAFRERMVEFPETRFIAAHLGGWPENLDFLDQMLREHANLYLDSSAAKWMVRELSRHSREQLHDFFQRWTGRILFGSDIVTRDGHLEPGGADAEDQKSDDRGQAFDLYASRYWALRTLFESDYVGESPIADPDLHLVDPERHRELDAPPLIGKSFERSTVRTLYHDAWHQFAGEFEA